MAKALALLVIISNLLVIPQHVQVPREYRINILGKIYDRLEIVIQKLEAKLESASGIPRNMIIFRRLI